jgi:hypothetical protein
MPLGVLPVLHERLDSAVQAHLTRLGEFQAPYLEEKLALDGDFPMERFPEAFTELKRYVGLAFLYRKRLDMPSRPIDEVWHQFILFTKEYHDFSNQFYGGYFHHSPYLPSRKGDPAHLENLISLYTQTYGPMPRIWREQSITSRRTA